MCRTSPAAAALAAAHVRAAPVPLRRDFEPGATLQNAGYSSLYFDLLQHGKGQGMPGCALPCSRQVRWLHVHVTESGSGVLEVTS